MLTIGDKVSNFTLVDKNNQPVSLENFINQKNIVLYFYPKDDTPGCTLEAQQFSQLVKEFEKLNTLIIGISQDSIKSHQNFCQKYDLNILLLSDPDHQVIEQYGAWQEKQMMGKQYMGTQRMTYLIDKKGLIRHIWPKVTPKGHATEVLEHLKKLS